MDSPSLATAGLNPAQREAVECIDGPLLVIAGAGSGKTRVITRRIAHMIERGVPGETILAVTFTNKAAREMSRRVHALVGRSGPFVSTFHSFGVRFLREEAERIGRPRNFTLFDRGDAESAVKRALERTGIDAAAAPPGEVVEEISRSKGALVSPEESMERAVSRREEQFAKLYAAYEAILVENGAFDFDDLIEKTVRLLETDESLRLAVNDCFRRLLVDEYQDVNQAQWRLVKALAGTERHVCVTGDPDQCIYAWRGADIAWILDFPQHFPGAKVVRLEQNYRSRNTVLRAASAVIRHNERHGGQELWSERGEGDPIVIRRAVDEIDEARIAVDRVRELVREGAKRSDIAIFYRLNSLSLPVERALISASIPYQVWRGLEFFARKEVKDAVAWLRFLVNPDDGLSLGRIINVPPRGIGAKAEASLETLARTLGTSPGRLLLEAGDLGPIPGRRAQEALASFGALSRTLAAERDEPIDRLLERILELSGLLDHGARQAERTGVDPRGNLEQLVGFAREFRTQRPGDGLEAFLSEISLLSDQDGAKEETEKVALMTVHTAKGLEFPHVILIGADQGLFPHHRPDRADDEEERRLFYVALTRAGEDLLLLTAAQRSRFGRIEPGRPSIFLTEIPEELTRVVDDAGSRMQSFAEPMRRFEPEEDPSLQNLRRGSRVRHPQWGHGTVRRISGRGGAARVDVEFDECGIRRLALAYAKLEPLEDESIE